MHISHKASFLQIPPRVAIFGCGNTLIGDDGFGPAVITALQRHDLPPSIHLVDAGTSIREYLLEYLMLPSSRPHLLIIIDAGFLPGKQPGTIQECRPVDIPLEKSHDFSLHQFPTVNLLREIEEETEMVVKPLLVQPETIPDTILSGLSPTVRKAVHTACQQILALLTPYVTPEVALS